MCWKLYILQVNMQILQIIPICQMFVTLLSLRSYAIYINGDFVTYIRVCAYAYVLLISMHQCVCVGVHVRTVDLHFVTCNVYFSSHRYSVQEQVPCTLQDVALNTVLIKNNGKPISHPVCTKAGNLLTAALVYLALSVVEHLWTCNELFRTACWQR